MKVESIIKVRNKVKVSFDDDTFLFLNEDIILSKSNCILASYTSTALRIRNKTEAQKKRNRRKDY